MTSVDVVSLGVTLDGRPILDDVSVGFPAGAVTVVTGPSGSGKTTLLTTVAGLAAPTSGRVVFRDPGGSETAPEQVRIGLVHQAFALLSLLSAAENVELALQLQGRTRGEVVDVAARCLDAVGLEGRGRHLTEELSGGEQQRVAIARALAITPHVLLADEPTAQLDAASRSLVLDLLRTQADSGVTVVVATHDLDVAAWADHHVVLEAGVLVPTASSSSGSGRHRRPDSVHDHQDGTGV